MSKVVVYCRVSTDKQEVEGTSLDTQQKACFAKAQELAGPDDEIVVLRETYSGLTLERPELTKLRDWVKQGQVKVVIIYSCDRLARDGLYLLLLVDEFEKAGAKVIFVTEPHESTPEGQLLTYVRGWASKLEALKIKERTTRGRKQRGREGRMPANGNLFGYIYIKGSRKVEGRGIRIPDTDKVPIVQKIFNWYVHEGLSLIAVRKRLYALGVLSPGGKSYWKPATIFRLLSNRAYTGETITHWTSGGKKEDIPAVGATPALIDRAIFDAAQERFRLNKENAKRRGKRDYILRGIVYCACGKRMVGHFSKGKCTYQCTGHSWNPNSESHCERTVGADKLESAVWEQIKDILAKPELVKAEIARRFGNTDGAAELEGQIKTIDARVKALIQGEGAIARKLRLGELSEDVATKELRQGQQDREALEREKSTLLGQLEGVERWADLDIDTLCHNALANLEAPTTEIKRKALQAFGTRVTVDGKEVRVTIAFPVEPIPESSFELQLL